MGTHKYGYSNATFCPAKKGDRNPVALELDNGKAGNKRKGAARADAGGDAGGDSEGSKESD